MVKKNDIHNYDDIINMPHHVSNRHPQMSRKDRAAQFAPFAALTGHKDAIKETERLTTQKKVIDEDQKIVINSQLQKILYKIKEHPEVEIIYFISDTRKQGGRYVTVKGNVKKIDEYENILEFLNGNQIHIHDISDIHII